MRKERNSCNAMPQCPGQWAVQLMQHTASLPWSYGQWNSRSTRPHCSKQWAVELLQCSVSPEPGYPKSSYSPFPLLWHDRHRYLTRKRKEWSKIIVHPLRANFNGCIALSWASLLRPLLYKLKEMLPTLSLFCTPKPALSLKQRFHREKLHTLFEHEKSLWDPAWSGDTQHPLLHLRET